MMIILSLHIMTQFTLYKPAQSIKSISKQVLSALLGVGTDDDDMSTIDQVSQEQHDRLRLAERGSLSIHCLVPGMCKAQTKPVMQHRADKVGEEIAKRRRRCFLQPENQPRENIQVLGGCSK